MYIYRMARSTVVGLRVGFDHDTMGEDSFEKRNASVGQVS